jgi:hypothetical protein
MNIDQKLNELRERYKNEPSNRKNITVQAKLLKMAQDLQSIEPIVETLKEKSQEEISEEVFGKV